MTDVVRARRSGLVRLGGVVHKVRQGSLADSAAQVVVDYPDLWEPLRVDYPADTSAAAAPTPAAVRAWARDQGIDVPARGKVPDDVIAQYRAAQGS